METQSTVIQSAAGTSTPGNDAAASLTALGEPPRKIRRRRAHWHLLAWLAVLPFAGMMVAMAGGIGRTIVLLTLGTPSTATVTKVTTTIGSQSPIPYLLGGMKLKYVHDLEYSYVIDGAVYTNHVGLNSDDYDPSLVWGSTIKVKSIHSAGINDSVLIDPIKSTLDQLAGDTIFGLIVPGLFLWGISHFLIVLPRRRRWLVKNGLPISGRITERPIRLPGEKYKRIRFEYSVGARRYSGAMVAGPEAYDAIKQGEAVTVLYDPRKPKRGVVYMLADFAIVDAAGNAVV